MTTWTTGLTGVDAADHSTRHENGGADEISIAGLSGEPADTVNKSLFDANSILKADADNTPLALSCGTSTIVARAAGSIGALAASAIVGGWNDYIISSLSLPLAHATAPTLTLFRDGLYLPAFTGGGALTKDVYCAIHIEHDYLSGTNVYPHIHWAHTIAAATGSVKWNIEYSVSKGHSQGAFPASTTVSIVQAAASAAYTHQIAEVADSAAIASTNIEPDSMVLMRVFRDPTDGSDTFENDAYMVAVDLHYQSDGVLTTGKVSPFTKTF